MKRLLIKFLKKKEKEKKETKSLVIVDLVGQLRSPISHQKAQAESPESKLGFYNPAVKALLFEFTTRRRKKARKRGRSSHRLQSWVCIPNLSFHTRIPTGACVLLLR